MLNRADLYFITEDSKSHLKTVTSRVSEVWIENGRGIKVRRGKVEVGLNIWVLHNLGGANVSTDLWKSKPVELKLNQENGQVKGLLEKSWQRWICIKAKRRMQQQGRVNQTESDMTLSMEVDELRASEMAFYDDMSGKELNLVLFKAARSEEMEEFKKHTVYEKAPLNQCLEETGKQPIGVRWVDVNKGDDKVQDFR